MAPKSKLKFQAKKNNGSSKSELKKSSKFKPTGKRGRLFIRNLPYSISEEDLEERFKTFGKIIDINLPRFEDSNKPKGFGFVNFNSKISASKAAQALSGKEFKGRTIHVELAVSKDRFLQEKNNEETNEGSSNGFQWAAARRNIGNKDDIKEEPEEEVADIKPKIKSEPEEYIGFNGNSQDINDEERRDVSAEVDNRQQNTDFKRIQKKKKARLIVRNLSFKTTEEKLKAFFSQFGEIIDLNLLRRIDNRLVGCAFVEFSQRKSGAKAIFETSGKPFLGRPIIVDWAIPKQEFKKANRKQKGEAEKTDDVKIKDEVMSEDGDNADVKPEIIIKEEKDDELDVSNPVMKEDQSSEDEGGGGHDDGDADSGTSDSDEEKMEEDDDDDEEDSDSEEEEEEEEKVRKPKKPKNPFEEKKDVKAPRFESHDVEEGKTVFIKNVPFSATNEELKKCVRRMFGPVYYALICIDPLTEHSRGTAFVKFQHKEDAERCLAAATEFTLNGTVLDPHPAIDRRKLKEQKEKDNEKNRDSRNLYLVKEGVVLAGTPAAEGVSMADMSKRLQLEQWKGEMLKNLNMFVSRNRLIIHNLPLHYDDNKLRKLFAQHSRPGAVIKETRVMRDLKNVDGKGIGISKGFGFISFAEFDDALQALRNLNNNPKVFNEAKRPIVAFSIENKKILNLKQNRLARSKTNNPLCRDFDPVKKQQSEEKKAKVQNRLTNDDEGNAKNNNNHQNGDNEKQYHGFVAKPGSKKLRSKFNIKVQAQTHIQSIKQKNKDKKSVKRKNLLDIPIKDKTSPVKNIQKKKKRIEADAHFNKLVDKYKMQLQSSASSKKWYE